MTKIANCFSSLDENHIAFSTAGAIYDSFAIMRIVFWVIRIFPLKFLLGLLNSLSRLMLGVMMQARLRLAEAGKIAKSE